MANRLPIGPMVGGVGNPWQVPPQIASVSVTNAERGKATLLDFIHPELKARAAEWIEYKTPEGKCYYFCPKTQLSVWEKPKVLVQLEGQYFDHV